MVNNSNKFHSKLKYYHIILISLILSPLLILNSNSLNKKREQKKILKHDEIILRELYARKLDSSSDADDFTESTNKICKKGSEDLQNYYKTSDGSIIGIKEDEPIRSENRPKYIDALVNLISSEGSSGDNIKEYLMHIIPVIVFLVIAILSLPGWLVCCICSCCDCYCCCCCKKPGCKIPFYIITLVIYVFGIAVSIYGLSQSNSIFVGLADTECSLLKFIGEVLDGETKEERPKWGGISNIIDLFEETKNKINNLGEETKNKLERCNSKAETNKNNFESALEKYSYDIYNDKNTDEGFYKHSLTIDASTGTYVLDIIKQFGKFKKNSHENDEGFAKQWYEEYKEISKRSKEQMDDSTDNYDDLINEKDKAISGIDDGINSIKEIKTTFDDVKDKIANAIVDYSDLIEEYGKLASKIVFSILLVINIVITVFISLRLFFSFGNIENRCLKCLTKSFIHILWNISALLTFLTLLIGSLFYALGIIGKDLVSVVSFLVSDENLDKGENAILLKDAAKYLKECINGDGDLKEVLNFNFDAMDNVDSLRNAKMEIENAMNESSKLLEIKLAYNLYKEEYNKIKNYQKDDFYLIKDDGSNYLIFKDYLSELNKYTQPEEWNIACDTSKEHSCDSVDSTHSNEYCINPSTCKDENVYDWYPSVTDKFQENVNVISAFINSINLARKKTEIDLENDTPIETKTIENVLNILDNRYTKFLESQTASLGVFNETITDLTGIFDQFAGEDGDIFSILNGKFIGKNVKVILKYLEKSLGTNFNSMGLCLIVAGLSMCFSIPLTILLNIIINIQNQSNYDGIKEIDAFYPNNGQNVNTAFETNNNVNINNGNPNDNNMNNERVIGYSNNI